MDVIVWTTSRDTLSLDVSELRTHRIPNSAVLAGWCSSQHAIRKTFVDAVFKVLATSFLVCAPALLYHPV